MPRCNQAWLDAWTWVTDNWHCVEWTPIPPNIRKIIPFHPQLGMWSGMLVTSHGVKGLKAFIKKMNRPIEEW